MLEGDQELLIQLVKAGRVRSFRDRYGCFRFDLTGYLKAKERRRMQLQRPHRIYWKDDPHAFGPPQGVTSGRRPAKAQRPSP